MPTCRSDYVVVVDGEVLEPNFLNTTYNALLDVAEKHLVYLFSQDRGTKKHIPLVTVDDIQDDLRFTDACPQAQFFQFQVVDSKLSSLPIFAFKQIQKNPLLWDGNWIMDGIKLWNAQAGN